MSLAPRRHWHRGALAIGNISRTETSRLSRTPAVRRVQHQPYGLDHPVEGERGRIVAGKHQRTLEMRVRRVHPLPAMASGNICHHEVGAACCFGGLSATVARAGLPRICVGCSRSSHHTPRKSVSGRRLLRCRGVLGQRVNDEVPGIRWGALGGRRRQARSAMRREPRRRAPSRGRAEKLGRPSRAKPASECRRVVSALAGIERRRVV